MNEIVKSLRNGHFVRSWIQQSEVIGSHLIQLFDDKRTQFIQRRNRLQHFFAIPIKLVKRSHFGWSYISSFLFKGMETQDTFANFRWRFISGDHQIDDRVRLRAIDTIGALLAGKCHFGHFLGNLNARMSFHFHQFENTAESWLCLTRHQIRSNAKRVNLVVLLFEGQESSFVDVVRGNDTHFVKSGD